VESYTGLGAATGFEESMILVMAGATCMIGLAPGFEPCIRQAKAPTRHRHGQGASPGWTHRPGGRRLAPLEPATRERREMSNEPADAQGEPRRGRVRRFLREVAERIGLVPFNPMVSVWDTARRDERERLRRERREQ
jgi:hypothetical protein